MAGPLDAIPELFTSISLYHIDSISIDSGTAEEGLPFQYVPAEHRAPCLRKQAMCELVFGTRLMKRPALIPQIGTCLSSVHHGKSKSKKLMGLQRPDFGCK